jgi:CheY-like chemotaxis protein
MKTIKVLLVEDDDLAHPLISKIVQEVFNTSLEMVETGIEAARSIEKNAYDLILMDLALLESDGFRITQEIRARKDAKKNVVIVGITAFLTDAVEKVCSKVGMNKVFAKPFTKEKCLEIKQEFFAE